MNAYVDHLFVFCVLRFYLTVSFCSVLHFGLRRLYFGVSEAPDLTGNVELHTPADFRSRLLSLFSFLCTLSGSSSGPLELLICISDQFLRMNRQFVVCRETLNF